MIALHESLVEWTVLALGIAVCTGLMLRVRMRMRLSHRWLPSVAVVVIVANAGIAVNAAAAAARSEAAGAWSLWSGSAAWASMDSAAQRPAPAPTAMANVAAAGNMTAAAGAAIGQHAESGVDALRLGALAAFGTLLVLLMALLYLNRSLRVLPSAAHSDDVGDCGADCPQCLEADPAAPAERAGRKRARGLTMTRLGGG